MGLILNPNILLSLKHPEHFERIRESISVEESIVPATMKLFSLELEFNTRSYRERENKNFQHRSVCWYL